MWLYCEIWNAVDPLPISDCTVEDGESYINDEENARQWWDIDSQWHLEVKTTISPE